MSRWLRNKKQTSKGNQGKIYSVPLEHCALITLRYCQWIQGWQTPSKNTSFSSVVGLHSVNHPKRLAYRKLRNLLGCIKMLKYFVLLLWLLHVWKVKVITSEEWKISYSLLSDHQLEGGTVGGYVALHQKVTEWAGWIYFWSPKLWIKSIKKC